MNSFAKKISDIEKRIKSFHGKIIGFGHCSCCDLTWNVVDGKDIPYVAKIPEYSWGYMFPVCEECFRCLKPEEIFKYCQELVNKWKETEPYLNIDMEIVKYNINYMKKVL